MECLRAELVEAKEEIRKLSADMRGRRQTGYGYDQLEELRNLQVRVLSSNFWSLRKDFLQKKQTRRLLSCIKNYGSDYKMFLDTCKNSS